MPPSDLQSELQSELRPLPSLVRSHLQDADLTTSTRLARRFADTWLGLERRLLALGLGYIRYIHERLPAGELNSANRWVNPGIARELDEVVDLEYEDRFARLHGALSRIDTSSVTDPPTQEPEPSCEPDIAHLITALTDGHTTAADAAVTRIERRWPRCQDRMVHLCASYSAYLAIHHGEQTMDAAHLAISAWAEGDMDAIVEPTASGSRARVEQVLGLLRAHTMGGEVMAVDDEVRIDVDCSSGLRMWRRDVDHFGFAEGPGPWTLGRDRLPYYCCRCTTNIMRFHRDRGDEPPWQVDPPHDASDVCRWSVAMVTSAGEGPSA